ncbi:M20/M25/M40 family metallo-hydrolase [Pseudoalteromonas denitrificans]|nr:M20/M25/M40 family metallo-hydrolase [Pseudoalteromonas denitrificans]
MNKVNNELLADLKELSSAKMQGRKTGSSGSHKAAQYIIDRYTDIKLKSLTTEYRQTFDYKSGFWSIKKGENIVGVLLSDNPNANYIAITAHYDHLGHSGSKIYYGADDNASGVAAMINIAKNLKTQNLKHHYIFIATDAEETGLYGAKAFLNSNLIDTTKIVLNINLDMLAVAPRQKQLYAFSSKTMKPYKALIEQKNNTTMTQFISSNRKMNIKLKTQKVDWRNASDHAIFRKHHIPFIYFCVGTHKYYHTTKDKFENISPKYYVASVKHIYQTILSLDTIQL